MYFFFLFQGLLPKGCCKTISYSDKYEDSWRCNFLGLPLEIALPYHILGSEQFLLMEIICPNDKRDDLNMYEFKISSQITLPDKGKFYFVFLPWLLVNAMLGLPIYLSTVDMPLIFLKDNHINILNLFGNVHFAINNP